MNYKKPKCRGVYFLYDKNEIVYIGRSYTDCDARVMQHAKDKEFDNWKIWLLDDTDLIDDIEKRLIIKHRPKYNLQFLNIKQDDNEAIIKRFESKFNKEEISDERVFKLVLAAIVRLDYLPNVPMVNRFKPRIKAFLRNPKTFTFIDTCTNSVQYNKYDGMFGKGYAFWLNLKEKSLSMLKNKGLKVKLSGKSLKIKR